MVRINKVRLVLYFNSEMTFSHDKIVWITDDIDINPLESAQKALDVFASTFSKVSYKEFSILETSYLSC